MKLKHVIFSTSVVALLATSCQKEFTNPNAATKEEVLKSPDGLMGIVVGTRREWSVGGTSALYNLVVCNGLTTREMTVLNTGNGDLASLEAGRSTLSPANAVMRNLWTSCNLTKSYAQQLIDNASVINDAGTRAGVQAYGHFYKALAIGTLCQFWEQVSTDVVSSADYLAGKRPTFKARTAALEEAITLLQQAETLITTTPISAAFTAKVGGDINLTHALPALIARYSLMVGKNDQALASANKVSSAIISSFKFDAVNQNPVFRSGLVSNNVVAGAINFGLTGALTPDTAAATRDGRIAFYLGGTTLSRATGFFKNDLDLIPVYLPSEMTLIKAEVLARQNKLPDAIIELNKIRQKTADPLSVTARLGAYAGGQTQAEVLTEIYRQRCIELYMSGLKLDDSRRFGRTSPNTNTTERNRDFYPYPLIERDINPNTPADPAI